jgi:thioredoxin 1
MWERYTHGIIVVIYIFMTMQWIIGGIVAVLALGGIVIYGNSTTKTATTPEVMQKDAMIEEVMQKETEESMEKPMNSTDAMMQKDDAMMQKDAMQKEKKASEATAPEAMMKKGSYSDYSSEKLALAKEGKVMLFFHAPWCPMCRALDAEFMAKETELSGVHILKVDFDTATALRQKYGVTVQHTFVQVDAAGTQIAKWSDASTLAAVLGKIK